MALELNSTSHPFSIDLNKAEENKNQRQAGFDSASNTDSKEPSYLSYKWVIKDIQDRTQTVFSELDINCFFQTAITAMNKAKKDMFYNVIGQARWTELEDASKYKLRKSHIFVKLNGDHKIARVYIKLFPKQDGISGYNKHFAPSYCLTITAGGITKGELVARMTVKIDLLLKSAMLNKKEVIGDEKTQLGYLQGAHNDRVNEMNNEADTMRSLKDLKHIAQIFDSAIYVSKKLNLKKSVIYMHLYKNGDLIRYINNIPSRNCRQLLDIADQLLLGLEGMHSKGLVHGDVKPGNIFLDDNSLNTVIGDFGRGVITHWYISPDRWERSCRLDDIGKVGWTDDVWALGITLLYCINSKTPNWGYLCESFHLCRAIIDELETRKEKTPTDNDKEWISASFSFSIDIQNMKIDELASYSSNATNDQIMSILTWFKSTKHEIESDLSYYSDGLLGNLRHLHGIMKRKIKDIFVLIQKNLTSQAKMLEKDYTVKSLLRKLVVKLLKNPPDQCSEIRKWLQSELAKCPVNDDFAITDGNVSEFWNAKPVSGGCCIVQ